MKTLFSVGLALLFTGCSVAPGVSDEAAPTETSSQPLVVEGANLGAPGPSGTLFQGFIVLAFAGTDSQINIVRQRPDGTWRAPDPLGEFQWPGRNQGPSIIAFRDDLHLTWFDNQENFCWKRSRDGVNWFAKTCMEVIIRGATVWGEPALVIHRNEINVLYAHRPRNPTEHGWNSFGRIHRRVFRDGQWLHLESFPAQTLSTPSAVVLNNELIAAWNHRDGQSFRTARFLDGQGWSSPNIISRAHEGHLISAVTWPESLVWVYRETGGNEQDVIKFDHTTDAVNFRWLKNSDGHTTGHRPFGIMAADGLIRWAHVGRDGVRGLNFNVEELNL